MKTFRQFFSAAILCSLILIPSLANGDISSLQDLITGGELTQGNTTFSNFELIGDFGSTSIDPTQIMVEIAEGSALDFFGNGQFSLGPSDESIIFQIGFDASTTGNSWGVSSVDLSAGNVSVADFGLVDVFNSVSDFNDLLAETNAIVDPGFGVTRLSDTQSLGVPSSDVSFVSSFSLFADSNSSVSIDSYRVSVSVPEPTSAILLSGLTIFSINRRRK